MATISKSSETRKQQEVCIDLPGESVQCWRSADSVKVILRKQRDVIFDLRLAKGKKYTIQSTHSDFYNARDKKLVYAKRNDVVTFNDGERMHVWVTRNFKGALLLKCDDILMMKIEPNKIDQHQYDDDPKTKPAPLIIALGAPSKLPNLATPKQPVETIVQSAAPRTAAAPVDEDCSLVCVVDGSLKDLPANMFQHFKKGGNAKSGLMDIDTNDIATRNWLWGQFAGTVAYAKDNWDWLRASIDGKTHQGFKLVNAKMHLVRGKVRFYFSGYSKFNKVFGPGGFGPGHEKTMKIFAGAGKTSSSFAAVAKGVAGSIKANALISFIFSSAVAAAEWKDDVSKDGYDLAATLLLGLLKTLVAAAITIAVVAVLVLAIMVGASASLPVLLVGAITVGVGVMVNYGVDVWEKRLGRVVSGDGKTEGGLSASLAPLLRNAGKEIEASWQYLAQKFAADYKEISF